MSRGTRGSAGSLRGAVALVTGSAGGLGSAIADRFRTAGVAVVGADLPGRGADVGFDVTDPAATEAAVAEVVAARGRLDVMVANAGIGVAGPVEALDHDAWRRTIDVNLWGAVNSLLAVYPRFVAQGSGHLVFVASLSGLVPTPLLVPYATTKAAVVGLAASLRPEAARHGVGVTVVCPGPVDTAFLDTGGVGGATDAVDVRRYLCDAAGPALSPSVVADAVWRGVERDRAVVAPGRAGAVWRAARLWPALVERLTGRAMRRELARGATVPRERS
jgi:short-subunit dehydrogenase